MVKNDIVISCKESVFYAIDRLTVVVLPQWSKALKDGFQLKNEPGLKLNENATASAVIDSLN